MLDRRGFLKFIGGGALGTLLTPAPWKFLYDAAYWTQNWSWIPRLKYGASEYTQTVSKLCPSGVGVLVRTVDGRPVRALGNPNNPLSQGGITALAAAETQLMCSPARLKRPLKRSSDGAYVAITWEEASALLLQKVKEAEASIACVSGDETGSINDLLSAFLNLSGSQNFYRMPTEEQAAQKAWTEMGGKGRIGYDIESADFILAIGANYLESWGTVVRNRKAYSHARPTGEEHKLTFAYAGAAQNNTAAGADFWLPSRVGTEIVVALGVAHLLIRNGARSNFFGYNDFAQLTSDFTPEKVETLTGIPAARLIAMVDAMTKAKKPLIIVGSELGNGMGALPIMAGIACNLLLAPDYDASSAGNMVNLPFPHKALTDADEYDVILSRDFIKYAQGVADKEEAPKLLLVYEANPVYALPKNAGVEQLIKKSDFLVSFSNFFDETASQANLIIPSAMGFERYDDVYTPYGSGFISYTVGIPACMPAFDSKPVADVLIGLIKALGYNLNVANAPELIAAKAEALGANMDTLLEGNTFVSDEKGPMSTFFFNAKLISQGLTTQTDLPLAVSADVIRGIGTSSTGIPPFATKLLTNEQLVGTFMVAQMNKATADKLKVRVGSKLKLSNEFGEVTALITLFEGVQNDTLLLPCGLGHTAFDAFSQNKGENIINLTGVKSETGTGLSTWGHISVNAVKV